MKKMLASDNALKVFSVIIAIVIWMYIAIVMDPVIEVSIRDLPIQFTGQSVLEDKGLAVINESATTVSIKVKGSRKKMGNYDMKTIIAKADISKANIGANDVPLEIVIPFESQGVSSQSVYSVAVTIEPIAQKTVDIEVKTTSSLAESYMCGDITTNPQKITIRGAQSAVEQITKALVKLDFKGADVDIDEKLPISLCDEKGKEIPGGDALLKRIKLSNEIVDVHCPVMKIKEVRPTANFGWYELPENFKYEIAPSVLYLYGADGMPAKVDKIETEVIDLDRLLENEKIKVKLNIPWNVKILGDVTEVEISVKK